MSTESVFLGATGGRLTGAFGRSLGTAAGIVAGASLGSVIVSFVTEDTYIILSEVSFAQIKEQKLAKKEIIFSRIPK
jgi:hypothetical protein|tara:strand:- start:1296 stop:1526 length:231 start_codon:yes stop_codon:yes gene_type:complete